MEGLTQKNFTAVPRLSTICLWTKFSLALLCQTSYNGDAGAKCWGSISETQFLVSKILREAKLAEAQTNKQTEVEGLVSNPAVILFPGCRIVIVRPTTCGGTRIFCGASRGQNALGGSKNLPKRGSEGAEPSTGLVPLRCHHCISCLMSYFT